ncbi:MAG: Na+/H+ antiporter NhaA [Bacteroidetes bacterium]|nr:Na+/H+ antiporter NhaA [Bacteroidota bacterium]
MIKRLFSPIYHFLNDSRATGIVLIICTITSLLLANSPLQESWLQGWAFSEHWVNDGLMVLFFFMAGMEIKRELISGELSSVQQATLPVLAAVGGMLLPAGIFALFNHGTPYANGWGIPMATDIAFSLGVISLLGKRVPLALKIFLTALAIIDDLGAIVTIAVFYTATLHQIYLLAAGGILIGLFVMNKFKVQRLIFYFIPGIILWYCILHSGIHATVAGVLLAFTIPLNKLDNLIHHLHKPVNFIIMPLFALANTAIVIPTPLGPILQHTINYGIIAGLVLGKPLGIFLFSFIAVKTRIAALPSQSNWSQLLGVGLLAGIGFTMSIFIATLAYTDVNWQVYSKIAVMIASLIAGIAGYLYLRKR